MYLTEVQFLSLVVCVSTDPVTLHLFLKYFLIMILKVTRLTRRKNELVSFVLFPDTYSFRHAFRMLCNPDNGIRTKRAKIEQVFNPNDVGRKRLRVYDIKTSKVTFPCVPV